MSPLLSFLAGARGSTIVKVTITPAWREEGILANGIAAETAVVCTKFLLGSSRRQLDSATWWGGVRTRRPAAALGVILPGLLVGCTLISHFLAEVHGHRLAPGFQRRPSLREGSWVSAFQPPRRSTVLGGVAGGPGGPGRRGTLLQTAGHGVPNRARRGGKVLLHAQGRGANTGGWRETHGSEDRAVPMQGLDLLGALDVAADFLGEAGEVVQQLPHARFQLVPLGQQLLLLAHLDTGKQETPGQACAGGRPSCWALQDLETQNICLPGAWTWTPARSPELPTRTGTDPDTSTVAVLCPSRWPGQVTSKITTNQNTFFF